MKKKTIGIIVAILLVIAVLGGGLWLALRNGNGKSGTDKVYVQPVSEISAGGMTFVSRYNGTVESQETWEIKKDANLEIKEMFVSVGDVVEEGTPLFEYDTHSLANQIQTLKLDMESIQASIKMQKENINDLVAQRDKAPEENKLEYTISIQSAQLEIKQQEYELTKKQNEIESNQKTIDNAVVKSKIAGVVKSIADESSYYSDSSAFMTILATGDYRVKGSVDEMGVYSLSEGMEVIVRSRVDETKIWKGKILTIDTERPEENKNNNYYDNEGAEKATKYPFYVQLDSTENLLLGQHVYVEPDYGQTTMQDEGISIDESYIAYDEDGNAFVWVSEKGKLAKRMVEVGDYNDATITYSILSGLSEDDLIAWNMEGLYEGITCVTDFEEVDYSAPLYNQEYVEGE